MRADARAKRAAIIAAARRLMAADGADVPLSAIAEAAGVGIGTLYRHFPERNDLLIEVAFDLRNSLLAIVKAGRVSFEEHPDPTTVWRETVYKLSAQRPGAIFPAIVARIEGGMDGGLDSVLLVPETLATVEGLLEHARANGLIDPSLTAQQFISAIGVLTRPLPRPVSELVGSDQSWLIDVYIRGIRPER